MLQLPSGAVWTTLMTEQEKKLSELEGNHSQAWKAYMAEVKAYEARSCTDSDGHKRPLVKWYICTLSTSDVFLVFLFVCTGSACTLHVSSCPSCVLISSCLSLHSSVSTLNKKLGYIRYCVHPPQHVLPFWWKVWSDYCTRYSAANQSHSSVAWTILV